MSVRRYSVNPDGSIAPFTCEMCASLRTQLAAVEARRVALEALHTAVRSEASRRDLYDMPETQRALDALREDRP